MRSKCVTSSSLSFAALFASGPTDIGLVGWCRNWNLKMSQIQEVSQNLADYLGMSFIFVRWQQIKIQMQTSWVGRSTTQNHSGVFTFDFTKVWIYQISLSRPEALKYKFHMFVSPNLILTFEEAADGVLSLVLWISAPRKACSVCLSFLSLPLETESRNTRTLAFLWHHNKPEWSHTVDTRKQKNLFYCYMVCLHLAVFTF